jgi:3'-phosphoadenosine 5'-phosphosulfate sulfotransferase
MSRIPEPDKRAARTLNEENIMDLTMTIEILSQMAGERDPVMVQRILRRAIPSLVVVLNRCHTLESYHAAKALRGSYGNDEEGE